MIIKTLLILSVFIINACSNSLPERFSPSGLNSEFNFDPKQNFSEYIAHSKEIISKARTDLNQENSADIIAWNSPFILEPKSSCNKKEAILLIHGLTDSPYSLRSLGKYFNDNCFLVYSILLTGHGTRPGDLAHTSYKDWQKQVKYAVGELSKNYNKIYIGGYSVGAALSLDYALTHPEMIKKLFLISPAIILPRRARFINIVRHFRKWNNIYDDLDRAKYESSDINSIVQTYRLTKEISRKLQSQNLKKIDFFAAITYEDDTVSGPQNFEILLKYSNPEKRHILLYHRNSLSPNIIAEQNLYTQKSTLIKNNILDMAHVSLPFSPQDIWYGKNGQYRSCTHYFLDKEKYQLCKNSNDIFYGERSRNNLQNHLVARLTYNPFLGDMLEQINIFLK